MNKPASTQVAQTTMVWWHDLMGWQDERMADDKTKRIKKRQWQDFKKLQLSNRLTVVTGTDKESRGCWKVPCEAIVKAVKTPGQPWVCWRSDGFCLQVCERQQGHRHRGLVPIQSQDRYVGYGDPHVWICLLFSSVVSADRDAKNTDQITVLLGKGSHDFLEVLISPIRQDVPVQCDQLWGQPHLVDWHPP